MWLCRNHSSYCAATGPRIACCCATRTRLNGKKSTLAVDLISAELTLVVTLVHETQHTLSVLAPCFVFPLVYLTIGPGLSPLAVLLVFQPLSHITCPVGMRICPLATCFVVQPLPLVNISIGVVQYSFSIGLIGPPLAHIPRPIGPNLLALPLPLAALPLSLVGHSVVQLYPWHFDPRLGRYDLADELVVIVGFASSYEVLAHLFLDFLLRLPCSCCLLLRPLGVYGLTAAHL